MKKYKVFISGPMRGYEKYNFSAFDKAEEMLSSRGIECVNPARISRKFKEEDIDNATGTCNEMVRQQQEAEKTCNAILLLDGWQKSKGVMLELKTAIDLDLEIFLEKDIDLIGKNVAVAVEEIADEDWKTQLARKYSNIPKGSLVEVLRENYCNFYGGPWTEVKWNGNTYWTDPSNIAVVQR